jgi:hypothetical protein
MISDICICHFSSASLQTKYELPMSNVCFRGILNKPSFELSELSSMSSLKPQQRQMSYLCSRCPMRYGLHRGPWKTTSGLILMKEGKDTWLSDIVCTLYCGVLHLKLACMYGIFIPYMFFWKVMMSSRKVINAIFLIWFLSIWLETQWIQDGIAFIMSTKRNLLFVIYTKYISGKYCYQKITCHICVPGIWLN